MQWIQSLKKRLIQREDAAEATDQETIKVPVDVRRAWQSMQGETDTKKLRQDLVVSMDHVFPVTAAALRKRKAEQGREHAVGDWVEGEGVFLCRYHLKDAQGKDLGRIFNVYAAPEDLTDVEGKKTLLTFNETVQQVAALRDWHGHHGGNYHEEEALKSVLKKGRYHGEWVIPPMDILGGPMQLVEGTLYAARHIGHFAKTFERSGKINFPHVPENYWSCTACEFSPDDRSASNFFADYTAVYAMDEKKMRCRPVRFVEVKI